MKCVISTVFWLAAALTIQGCVTYARAPWRPGASRSNYDAPLAAPTDPAEVALYAKPRLGAFDQTESRRIYACGTTTVLRKAYPVDELALEPTPAAEDWEPVADLTTEEFPRDETRSERYGDGFVNVLGIGPDPYDLFDVRLDPAFAPDALDRLRAMAAALGADAVVDVYATGAAEFHHWHGFRLGIDPQEADSPTYTNLQLLDMRLRDVRLHGRAVRRAR